MGIKIKQGYPEKVIGEVKLTESGWFFNPNENCKMIHENTLRQIRDIMLSHSAETKSEEKMEDNKGIGNMRVIDFLECMGNGKPIHQCEEDNDFIDSESAENKSEDKE